MTMGRRLGRLELLLVAWFSTGCHGVCYDTVGPVGSETIVPVEEWDAFVEAANGDVEAACYAACEAQPGFGQVTDCESSAWPEDEPGTPTGRRVTCDGIGAITSPCE